MRLKAAIIIPLLILSSSIFAQKGLELGINTGILIDQFKVLDGGRHILPQLEDSNSLGLFLRKGISNNLSVETGLTYKYTRGDFFNRIFNRRYEHLMIPVKINGKFVLSKKNKIYLVPSTSLIYITNALGNDSYTSNEFEHSLQWAPDNPPFYYSLNSNFNGNTLSVAGELALEFVIFSKLTFHLGYQISSAFRDVYTNNLEYFEDGQNTFTATISSKNQYRGYNLSFYFPICEGQKN